MDTLGVVSPEHKEGTGPVILWFSLTDPVKSEVRESDSHPSPSVFVSREPMILRDRLEFLPHTLVLLLLCWAREGGIFLLSKYNFLINRLY